MKENIKAENTSEVRLSNANNFTSDVSHRNEVKAENFVTELDTLVKQELTSQSLEMHIKSEAPDLEWDAKTDDISMKEILHEEIHLKTETGQEDLQENICTAAKPLKCDICDYRCTRKGHLHQHMNIHAGEKPFKCTVCDYRCARRSSLQRHRKIHANKGEKFFKCKVCDYTCAQKRFLNQHLQTHMAEKPFKCKECNYKCIKEMYLHRHMRTHARDQLFQCHLCDYRCSEKSTLKLHLKTHTGENQL